MSVSADPPVDSSHPPAASNLEAIPLPGAFDLELTLNCGQVFHWQRQGDGYAATVGATPVYVEQRGEVLWATPGRAALLHRYFALDHPLEEIYATLPRDPAMQAALAACRGLRIIRQPLWECLATFITSALKQVAHIAQISHTLRRRFGQPTGDAGASDLFAYPSIERMARLQEAELRACGLGFRAVSVLAAAKRLAAAAQGGQPPLEDWRALPRADALKALTELRGVGAKVANCVLLFGYGHLDAFPVDVWIERVLRESYFQAEPAALRPLRGIRAAISLSPGKDRRKENAGTASGGQPGRAGNSHPPGEGTRQIAAALRGEGAAGNAWLARGRGEEVVCGIDLAMNSR